MEGWYWPETTAVAGGASGWQRTKLYLVTGGLPEVVAAFLAKRADLYAAFQDVRRIQTRLVSNYIADMAKHCGKQHAMHLERLWRSVPAQIGRDQSSAAQKFVFKDVLPGIKGYYVENFVSQTFRATNRNNLACWREGAAEVDFITEADGAVVPVEVKSGWVTQAKRLYNFSLQPYSIITRNTAAPYVATSPQAAGVISKAPCCMKGTGWPVRRSATLRTARKFVCTRRTPVVGASVTWR